MDGDRSLLAWTGLLFAYTGWRSFRPIRFVADDVRSTGRVVADIALHVLVVVATGYWASPFVFSLITTVIVAGFAEGFGFAIRSALTASAAVSLPLLLDGAARHNLRTALEWSTELVLVGLVAGYGRRLFGEAEQRHILALDRMSRLAEANALLFSLHRVAQTLPASLDLDEVLASTMRRLRDLLEFDAAAIILRDTTTGTWVVGAAEGVRLPEAVEPAALPAPVRQVMNGATGPVIADLYQRGVGPGISGVARSGMYAPLLARSALVGVVAVERRSEVPFGPRDADLLDGVTAPAALAVDNAHWFRRLRTVGADEERTRIARDLHDRIGQSLAYLAFELDRLTRKSASADVHDDLAALRQDVRQVVVQMRETLYDLRTDVSEGQDLVEVLESFLARVGERSGLEVVFHHDSDRRLPLPQERELWRIAQEAVTNIERHARARRIVVRWWCRQGSALLVVSDDGVGLPPGSGMRIDAYGMLGMRERADSIGAQLEVESSPEQGTTIRCRLETA